MKDKQAAAGRTQSSICHPYSKKLSRQLSQEAAVSVQMQSTDSERLSATLEDEDVQAPSMKSMLGTVQKVQ